MNFFWTGVDFFFVISGFVFAPTISRGSLKIIPYAIGRLLRIYSLYLVALFAYFLSASEHPLALTFLYDHIFMLHTLTDKENAYFFNAAFWSLPAEIQFYIFVPVLAFLTRLRLNLWALMITAVLLRFAIYQQAMADPDNSFFQSLWG
jgi:exopolysaccharide production protein ExoZ